MESRAWLSLWNLLAGEGKLVVNEDSKLSLAGLAMKKPRSLDHCCYQYQKYLCSCWDSAWRGAWGSRVAGTCRRSCWDTAPSGSRSSRCGPAAPTSVASRIIQQMPTCQATVH